MNKNCNVLLLGMLSVVIASNASSSENPVTQSDIEALRDELAELRQQYQGIPVRSAQRMTFNSPDDLFSVTLQGRVQARYEYLEEDQAPNTSAFSLRRVRLDLSGHTLNPDITWRIMPELNRSASLRDGWINYRFSNTHQIRVGQFNVPFAWERDASSSRQQFVEFSVANNEFQWADGRDIGVMAHGRIGDRFRYGTGVFGGNGRNVEQGATTGHLYTGRVSYDWLGSYPNTEALITPVNGIQLATGLGLGYANRNTARDWTEDDESAAITSLTADLHLLTGGFSGHLMGFYREVDPSAPTQSYEGAGYTIQAGHLLIPNRMFASFRYSYSEPNKDEQLGRIKESMLSIQLFQHGHQLKLHLEAGRERSHNELEWRTSRMLRSQVQLLF